MSVIMMLSLTACFDLDFLNKNNSLCDENIEYLKTVDTEVTIMVCSEKKEYINYMQYFAQEYYGVITDYTTIEYFEMTQNLLSKYDNYKCINVEYIDPQSVEFASIATEYSNYQLNYGDMVITAQVNGNNRIKVLTFEDIYIVTEGEYYITHTITGNSLETALTGAIAHVTNKKTKKVAVLSGHSDSNSTDAYKELLETNNYDVTENPTHIIKSIPQDYDAIIIFAPTTDFADNEIKAISEFLDNNGKKGKGLIFFAAPTNPSLPNFYSFLKQWGIEVKAGVVFETDSSYHLGDSPSTIGVLPAKIEDQVISNIDTLSITGFNAPMKVIDAAAYERKAVALMQTSSSSVIAPIGSDETWADYEKDDKQIFDCVIQSTEENFDLSTNKSITSYIMAFSSIEFVESDYAHMNELSNQDIVMACIDRACHIQDETLVFAAKVVDTKK